MAKIGQVQAVVNAVTEVLGDAFVPGTTVVSETISEAQKETIRDLVKNGILNGEVAYSKDVNDPQFNRYVNGMINNTFTKSKKLNGNRPYKPSKKGTPRDATLKQLNAYLKTQTPGTSAYNDALSAVNNRKTELSQIAAGIDTSVLPNEVANILDKSNL